MALLGQPLTQAGPPPLFFKHRSIHPSVTFFNFFWNKENKLFCKENISLFHKKTDLRVRLPGQLKSIHGVLLKGFKERERFFPNRAKLSAHSIRIGQNIYQPIRQILLP